MKSAYQILEIPEGSNIETAKKAFRRLAHIWHPDKQNGNAQKFIEVKKAYEDIEKGIAIPKTAPKREPSFTYNPHDDFWTKIRNLQEQRQKAMEQMMQAMREQSRMQAQQQKETLEEWKQRMYNSIKK